MNKKDKEQDFNKKGSKKIKPNELNIVRVYDAPVKAVWNAWTDPNQAAKWWGPRGFTITTHNKDLRAGGSWDYTMHGPDGVDYPNLTKYFEVETYSKLVYDHGGSKDRPPLFRVTVMFSEDQGKTTMDMTMSFATPEIAAETKKFIKKANGDSTWDRLAEYLCKESSGKELFVINRAFDAPINVMFEMWSDPKHLAKWVAPTGFTMEYLHADIRPGGRSFYRMSGNGMEMYGQANYIELVKPNRIVYSQNFCDKDGNMSRHPMAPTWPATMLTKITLAEEDFNKTRVTIAWECLAPFSAEEIATFIAGRPGMTGGWTGSLDKLEEYLSKL